MQSYPRTVQLTSGSTAEQEIRFQSLPNLFVIQDFRYKNPSMPFRYIGALSFKIGVATPLLGARFSGPHSLS